LPDPNLSIPPVAYCPGEAEVHAAAAFLREPISEFNFVEPADLTHAVPGRILHDFRRTAVRNLERAGVPRSVAMRLVGHKTESVYRRYAIADDRDLRVAVERLDAVASAV
jgi:integrase